LSIQPIRNRSSKTGEKLKSLFVALIFSLFSLTLTATAKDAKSSVSLIGTFIDVDIKNGKHVRVPRFETLPKKWSKNKTYYEAILLNDPKKELANKKLIGRIDIVKNKKVVDTMQIPANKIKKVGDKYFLTAFKKLVPNPKIEAPYIIHYQVKADNGKTYFHFMNIAGGD
jgi:hypothetical protein